MIDCMTLEQMMHFVSLLGDIVTIFGDYDVVRIEAETDTTWWFRMAATAGGAADGADGPPEAILCQRPLPPAGR